VVVTCWTRLRHEHVIGPRLANKGHMPFAPVLLTGADRGWRVLGPGGGASYVFLRTGRRVSTRPEFPNQPV
jgi:hypothetical protein